ncbi:conjugal transfer protein TrbL [Nocardioides sp. NPDC006303]|uniref:conjugal transfer protein TrbL n=1 Tax=Nocardioides sp. NPDC006303 TaxID=3156747 RepID=UPI0033B4BEE0
MSVCDVPGINEVCNTAGEQAVNVATLPFQWLADALAATAKTLIETTWTVIDDTTMVDLTTGHFTRIYNIVFGIAIVVMLGFFLLQIMTGLIRREPAALTRAILGLAKSVIGSFLALGLLATALEITDQLARGIVHAAGTNMDRMGEEMAVLAASVGAISTKNPSVGIILTIIMAGLFIGATFLVWLSLLARKALLLVAVVLAPFALAGASWDHTRTWVSRWASFVIALILSKLVVVVIFLLATSQVSAPIDADLTSLSEPLSGVVLLLIAGFAPYLTYKAINFMGFDMYHAMSAEQETKHALNRPLPLPIRQPILQPQKVLGGGSEQGNTPQPNPSPSAPTGGVATTAGSQGGTAAASSAMPVAAGAAAGVHVAKEGATAGPKAGTYVGAAAQNESDAAEGTAPQSREFPPASDVPPPQAPLPRVVDPTPTTKPGTKP